MQIAQGPRKRPLLHYHQAVTRWQTVSVADDQRDNRVVEAGVTYCSLLSSLREGPPYGRWPIETRGLRARWMFTCARPVCMAMVEILAL